MSKTDFKNTRFQPAEREEGYYWVMLNGRSEIDILWYGESLDGTEYCWWHAVEDNVLNCECTTQLKVVSHKIICPLQAFL